MSFLFISLPWLSNKLLWSINKLKQGLWCTILLPYIYIYILYIDVDIYVYIYIHIYMDIYIYIYIYIYIGYIHNDWLD